MYAFRKLFLWQCSYCSVRLHVKIDSLLIFKSRLQGVMLLFGGILNHRGIVFVLHSMTYILVIQ